MKPINKMTQAELAAFVQSHLREFSIEVILSGGAAVGIYSHGAYVSKDIDLVNAHFAKREKIEEAMRAIGFKPNGRHFEHPDTDHVVEFPPGPLLIGDSSAVEISELPFDTGLLRAISPFDCIKDRLVHYYHWGDRQCLLQAKLVAKHHDINIVDIREWSKSEGKLAEFETIKDVISNSQ